jgi:precorrin-6B C5,15-methyltransferase / cobalt-precorrin-6B C5,C15-methyltransferase
MNAVLYPGARILVLSAGRQTPSIVAGILKQRGYGESQITILEHLGGADERIVSCLISSWQDQEFADLNTIALDCAPFAPALSRASGLPDSEYRHDGQLTKREMRAITLSTLAPLPGQLLWDVGAGCGSIAIEWLRSHPRCQAIAIEQKSERLQFIAENAAALGVPHLSRVLGQAPDVLMGLPQPDAIFIGGGLTISDVFETCWEALKPGGRLVANGVTVETEYKILQLHRQYRGDLSRIAIQRADPIGQFLGWKAFAGITQWSVSKV